MQQLTIAIVPTLAAPPEGAQLVIFCDPRGYVAEIDSSMMLAAAARYAIRHKVYLVPERFIAANYLCLCLLSPQGVVIGAQRAVHLNLSLREHNYYRDDAIRPFDTPLGRVALLVDVDVNMPQVARAAVEAGATLLLSSQFIQLYDLYEDRVRYGAINAAVSNGVNVAAAPPEWEGSLCAATAGSWRASRKSCRSWRRSTPHAAMPTGMRSRPAAGF